MRGRIATLMVHTSPLDQAGMGDAGGMNIYVVESAIKMAAAGVDVDIYTRSTDPYLPKIVGTFINEEATTDSLTGISVSGISATLSSPSFNLVQNTPVIFAGDSANATGSVPGLNAVPGNRVNVVLSFSNSPSVTLSALVRAKSDYFANVGGTPAPSASPTATK